MFNNTKGTHTKERCKAAVVVERSNSFNSNIDWIAHGIDRWFEPAWCRRIRRFFFGHVNSVDREASIGFDCACALEYSIVNSLHINRFVFGLITREASINISTDNRHIHYRSALTHTHTHTQTHRHNTLQIWSFSNMPLFRGLMWNSSIGCFVLPGKTSSASSPCIGFKL